MVASFHETDLRHRIAFEREQGISFREICDNLNRDGILTKRGLPWTIYNLYFYALPEKKWKGKDMQHLKSRKAMPAKEEPTHTVPKRNPVSIRNVHDVKRVLASTINELRAETMTPLIAGKIIYGCTVMLTVFEQFDMAEQIKELERRAATQWQK